jgi:hypothetical protein
MKATKQPAIWVNIQELIMSTKMTKLVLALGAMAMAGGAMAQSFANTQVTASATVIRPITIAKVTNLNFGVITPGASEGSVYIYSNSQVGTSGGTSAKYINSGASAAAFTLSGEGGEAISVMLPEIFDRTMLSSGDNTMTVSDFTASSTNNSQTVTSVTTLGGTRGSVGTLNLYVGAKLAVAANQAPGSYSGSFNVSVAYN